MLCVAVRTLYKEVEDDHIPFFRVRTSIRFDPHQVADWLEMKMPSYSVGNHATAGKPLRQLDFDGTGNPDYEYADSDTILPTASKLGHQVKSLLPFHAGSISLLRHCRRKRVIPSFADIHLSARCRKTFYRWSRFLCTPHCTASLPSKCQSSRSSKFHAASHSLFE